MDKKPDDWNKRAYGPLFKKLRPKVMKRNDGKCAICGQADAYDCHHSPMIYPDGRAEALKRYHAGCPKSGDLRVDHMIQLCRPCHDFFVTRFRQFIRNGATFGEILEYIMMIMPDTVEKMREDGKLRKAKAQPPSEWAEKKIHAEEKPSMEMLRKSIGRQIDHRPESGLMAVDKPTVAELRRSTERQTDHRSEGGLMPERKLSIAEMRRSLKH